LREDPFGVDEGLGAAKGDETDLRRGDGHRGTDTSGAPACGRRNR
jgi:hypothetical protein